MVFMRKRRNPYRRTYRRPFKRSRYNRYRTRRPYRGYRRRRQDFYGKVYVFRSKYQDTSISFTSKTPGDLMTGYHLNGPMIPGFSDYGSYDQYKIIKWKIEFVPEGLTFGDPTTLIDTVPAHDFGMLRHYLVVDYTDDQIAPTSTEAEFINHPRVKVRPITRPMSMIIRPRFRAESHTGNVTTGFSPQMGWISTDTPIVNHYGFKHCVNRQAWYNEALPPHEYTIRVYHTVYYAFKNRNTVK